MQYRATGAERTQVPPHKRLENAPAGRGLPIGNLSSQFFANVYLDALDQFAKRELHAKRYLRYVDDFVLFHHDRAQLQRWQTQIEQFLSDQLSLGLKADIRLRRLTDGLDFLGYVIYPTHTLARRRVIGHARAAMAVWGGCARRRRQHPMHAAGLT
ncbi:RNA-directed DNA polymerase [Xanthomonas sp. AM6]|uniref:RNA-directed DNA polymerase n=1 Tax=Xanthomonas sp. AM6 TaxID=2982531 RepID=UPI0021DAAE26|nr:RNA-directed DNA polymerase [Xanthomonas sp. AM6]UYB52167.1 RNA-directed DNA polymerase [Xanthomonas sp. AM6]